jgi:hypothetical protein
MIDSAPAGPTLPESEARGRLVAPTMPSWPARFALSTLAALAVTGLISAAAWLFLAENGPARESRLVQVVIPPGTAATISAGERVSPLPARFALVEGDTLLVRNDDVVDHRVGAYVIYAGQSANLPLDQPGGEATFLCTFHPGGVLGISVRGRSGPLSVLVPTLVIGLPLGLVLGVVLTVAARIDDT